MDGTDCPVKEPYPFNPHYYSQKLNHAGLRFEIGLSISTGLIVWINGPFVCRSNSDLIIVRKKLKWKLKRGERALGDNGYQDGSCLQAPISSSPNSKFHCAVRARHENLNGLFKNINTLKHTFRHSIEASMI